MVCSDIPMYHVTSWYDIFLHGGLTDYCGLRERAMTAEGRAQQKLLIGPWAHRFPYTAPSSGDTGDIDFCPNARIELHETQLRWFDYYLKGIDTGILDEPPVKIFVMGGERLARRTGSRPRRAQPHAGCVARRGQYKLSQWSAKTQSRQGYSRACSGDADTANTVTRYCAIGFGRDWDVNCNEPATFNKRLLASIVKPR